jgi:hypothetical protein
MEHDQGIAGGRQHQSCPGRGFARWGWHRSRAAFGLAPKLPLLQPSQLALAIPNPLPQPANENPQLNRKIFARLNLLFINYRGGGVADYLPG